MGLLDFLGKAAVQGVNYFNKKDTEYRQEYEHYQDGSLLIELTKLKLSLDSGSGSISQIPENSIRKTVVEELLKERGYKNYNGVWSKDGPRTGGFL